MVVKWSFIFACLILFYSSAAHSELLTKIRLEKFSEKLSILTQQSHKNIYQFLSDDLQVESSIGSSAQGLTLFFNKSEYIELIENTPQYYIEQINKADIDIFDFKLNSSTQGQFTVTTYSKTLGVKVWSTYFVELVNNELLIVKIVEAV